MRYALCALAILFLGCGAPPAPPERPSSPAPPPRHVTILLSIDAMMPADLDDPEMKLPVLRALIARGARAKSMVSVWPSVTYPAHATMVTGVLPREHGIMANTPFDPKLENGNGWFWYAEDFKVKTLWQAAREKGLTTANVYWPTTVGADFDWSFPQFWRKKIDEDDKLLRVLASPRGLAEELRKAAQPLPTEHRDDRVRAEAAAFLLREKKPDFLLVYLTDLDTIRHKKGPASVEAKRTLEAIDEDVGLVLAATADPAMDHTSIVVVSDHGFLPVSQVVRPLVFFKEKGLVDYDAKEHEITRTAVGVSASGGLVAIGVTDPTAADKVARAVDELVADPRYGVERVYDEAAMRAVGAGFPQARWTLEAKRGFMFDGDVEGPVVEPSKYKGTHGWPPEMPEMRACFLAAGARVRSHVTLPDISILDVAPTVAQILDVPWRLDRARALPIGTPPP